VHSIVALHYSLFSATIMVDRSVQVFKEYEERLRNSDNVPRFSYGRRMMRDDGDPNRYFLMYLFCEQSMAIQFLQDIGLLRSKMQCNTCGRDMTWSADRNITEGFRWRCQRSVAGIRCNQSVSIKFGSWFPSFRFLSFTFYHRVFFFVLSMQHFGGSTLCSVLWIYHLYFFG
jgi:hypothetical protein